MPDILNRYQELINNYTSISESNELFNKKMMTMLIDKFG